MDGRWLAAAALVIFGWYVGANWLIWLGIIIGFLPFIILAIVILCVVVAAWVD